jgi:hypothetical protein
METFLSQNIPKYYCDICQYITNNKKDFDKHILTRKHKKLTIGNTLETISPQNPIENAIFTCQNCCKEYFSRAGLWKHKKKCQEQEIMIDGINIKDKDTLVLHLLKQNSELQNKIIEMASISSLTNNNINNNNNNNNKTFNLQFFLNETCKNAMNISEFVSSIKMDLDDLEHTGRTGYIEGISNIVIKNLNSMEQHLRPLHCSDYKREVLYIKENNEWTKDVDNKPILTKAIKTIANENIKLINKWVQNYPDCTKSDSKKNDLYLKIVSNSMNGLTKEEGEKNINKIINNIAKNVTINKQ